jgi:hypothetical protein
LSNGTRRFSDCANKHGRKVTASAGKHEQMPDEMAITQTLVREKYSARCVSDPTGD